MLEYKMHFGMSYRSYDANTAASYEHKSQQSEGDTLPPCAKGLEQRQGLLMSKS